MPVEAAISLGRRPGRGGEASQRTDKPGLAAAKAGLGANLLAAASHFLWDTSPISNTSGQRTLVFCPKTSLFNGCYFFWTYTEGCRKRCICLLFGEHLTVITSSWPSSISCENRLGGCGMPSVSRASMPNSGLTRAKYTRPVACGLNACSSSSSEHCLWGEAGRAHGAACTLASGRRDPRRSGSSRSSFAAACRARSTSHFPEPDP